MPPALQRSGIECESASPPQPLILPIPRREKHHSKGKIQGKSRDCGDRVRITFDVGGLCDRLKAQASEPNQSLASIVRMAVLEWLAERESKSKSEDSRKID